MESRIRILFLRLVVLLVVALLASGCSLLRSNDGAVGADDQSAPVIDPDVSRREVKPPKIDTEDFELQAFVGLISIQDFGSNTVYGARLGYHVTEDLFLEATYGQATDVDKSSIELLLPPAGLLGDDRDYSYYDLSIGYNLLPGEVFIGSNWAFNSAFYVVAGAGNTSFHNEDLFTLTLGLGYRMLLTDAFAAHFDVRDHLFDDDITGADETKHNIEFSLGLSWFF